MGEEEQKGDGGGGGGGRRKEGLISFLHAYSHTYVKKEALTQNADGKGHFEFASLEKPQP